MEPTYSVAYLAGWRVVRNNADFWGRPLRSFLCPIYHHNQLLPHTAIRNEYLSTPSMISDALHRSNKFIVQCTARVSFAGQSGSITT